MTDFDAPDEQLDELASAYLDGVATPDEVAMVEADTALLELVAVMRRQQEELAALPSPAADELTRARHLRAAMALYDETTTTGDAVVTNFGDQRSLDQQRARRAVPRWLSTAAVAMVALGGLGFALQQLNGSGDDDASDAAEERVSASASSEDTDTDFGDDGEATTEASDGLASESAAVPEAATDDAMESDDAMSDTTQDAAEDGVDEAEEEAQDDEGAADELPLTPSEALGAFPAGTALEEIVTELRSVVREPETSACVVGAIEAGELFGDDPTEVPVGSLPVLLGDELVEIILVQTSDGLESLFVVDAGCLPVDR